MTKEAIVEKTIRTLKVLPPDKAEEVADFAEYIMKKHEDNILKGDIQNISAQGETFNFLNYDEDIYSIQDIKSKS